MRSDSTKKRNETLTKDTQLMDAYCKIIDIDIIDNRYSQVIVFSSVLQKLYC